MIKATVNLGLEDEDGRIEIEPPEIDEFFDQLERLANKKTVL